MKRGTTLTAFGLLAAFGASAALGVFAWFEFAPAEQTCVKCHELRSSRDSWMHAAHHEVGCKDCHGGTADGPRALGDNVRRLWRHVSDADHSGMALGERQVAETSARCGACHADAYAQWRRGGHGSPVSKFLMDEKHNRAWKPADNCLRCHGMFLAGDLDSILAREWPHKFTGFRDPAAAAYPAIPCLACHRLHADPPAPGATNWNCSATAFYSRPDRARLAPAELYAQMVVKDGRPVRKSADPRQRLCSQCHAANAETELGSGDDRTPIGVHEGISCLACHRGHDLRTGETCGSCHAKCVKGPDSEMLIHGRESRRARPPNEGGFTVAPRFPAARQLQREERR